MLKHNLHDLFQNEEGLLKSLAIRDLDLEHEYPPINASPATN